MIVDLCRMVKIAFTPVKKRCPEKFIRKTIIDGQGELIHVKIKTHYPKDSFMKNK